MSGKTYPGFVLTFLHRSVKQDQLKETLTECLDPVGDGHCFRDGCLQVRLIQPVKGKSNFAIVSGCLLPFVQIRAKLAGIQIRVDRNSYPLSIFDKDFGIVRCEETGLIRHEDIILQKRFLTSYGNSNSIEVFHCNHVKRIFKGQDRYHKKIGFSPSSTISSARLDQFPKSLSVLGVLTYATAKTPSHEIQFKYRLDALQLLLSAAQSNKSLPTGSYFFMAKTNVGDSGKSKSLFKEVALQRARYLGADGTYINSEMWMSTKGYIPFDCVNQQYLSTKIFGEVYNIIRDNSMNLKTVCSICRQRFTLVGFDPDFSYFAARCSCDPKRSANSYEGEDFFRLTETETFNKKWSKYEETAFDSQIEEPLIPLIPGLKPFYQSPVDFGKTAGNLFLYDMEEKKREYCLKGCKTAILKEIELNESVRNDEKTAKNYYRLVFSASKDKSKVWTREKQHSIGHAIIVLRPENSTTRMKKWSTNYLPTFHSVNACLYDINDAGEQLLITMCAEVPNSVDLFCGKSVELVPCPPTIEGKSLRLAIAKWNRFFVQREMSPPEYVDLNITHVVPVQQGYIRKGYKYPATSYELVLEMNDWDCIREWGKRIFCYYIGGNVVPTINNNATSQCPFTIRVVGVERSGEKGLLTAVAVTDQHCPLTLGPCKATFWAIDPYTDPPSPMEANSLKDAVDKTKVLREESKRNEPLLEIHKPDAAEKNEKIREENWIRARSMRDASYLRMMKKERFLQYFCNPDPQHLDMSKILNLSHGTVVKCWLEKPREDDYSVLDFLLEHGNTRNSCDTPTPIKRLPNPDYCLVKQIKEKLNSSQVDAIEKMINNKISYCLGSPGTGKSSTACHGIQIHKALEDGLVVVASPSNFASEVVLDKLWSLDKEFTGKKPLNIVRMFSFGKEMSMLEKKNRNHPAYLHNVVSKTTSLWDSQSIEDIFQVLEEKGQASLTKNERDTLSNHIYASEIQVLEKADVVVCTVGSATDGRLETVRKRMHLSGRFISLLVVDEGSLLTLPGLITLFTLQPSRVWILGDPFQLPPTITSQSSLNGGLDVSLMHLAHSSNIFAQDQIYSMLNVQYRMANQIGHLVSKFSYHGKIKSDTSVMERNYRDIFGSRLIKQFHWMGGSYNICVENYRGSHERIKDNSYFNKKEVDIVRSILKKLRLGGVRMSSVTVLTMYDGQRKMLLKMRNLLGPDFKDVVVANVDSYQGKENDFVILSMVRSNNADGTSDIGFLRDKRRLNVALSRPKHCLFVVADLSSFEKCEVPEMQFFVKLLKETSYVNNNC